MKLVSRKLHERLCQAARAAAAACCALVVFVVAAGQAAVLAADAASAAATAPATTAAASRAASVQLRSEPVPGGTVAPTAAPSVKRPPAWVNIPRVSGRLHATDLGLVINTTDPDSVAVGDYYIAARKLLPEQVLRVELPVKPTLTREEFERLRLMVETHFGNRTQALALAWTVPYAVECNSITGALALGFDAELCRSTCGPSRSSAYFNSPSSRPLTSHGWRPAMLLAGRTLAMTKAMIDRGVAADGALLQKGRPVANVLLLQDTDALRGVRQALYPPAGLVQAANVDIQVVPAAQLPGARNLLLVTSGSVKPELEPAPTWVPGGVGDHLTSFGGDLVGQHGQGTALDWIAAGATASHGAVSEPCNHLQKFPHPQVLLLHYMQGATVIEAYWKSVYWPQQSLFIGEPLAAPFAPR